MSFAEGSVGLSGGVPDSDLFLRAQARLDSLPLAEAANAGYVRERDGYFLNIAYPSMQAMAEVTEDQVFAKQDKDEDGENNVALYVHVPFCSAECYYCHYYKEFKEPEYRVEEYLDGVEAELQTHVGNLGEVTARSVYIGGGTPSYLTPDQLDRLFSIIANNVDVETGAEVSMEMHPESSDPERLAAVVSAGVNRLNIGVESFDEGLLRAENRRHTREEAIEAFKRAQAAGIDNVNLDFIYGLKGQTLPIWEDTLDTIGRLSPSSATLYYLRLKRATPEYKLYQKYPEQFPSEEELLLMHAMTFERLEGDLGYTQNPVDWFIRDPKYFHTYQDHNWRKSDQTALLGVGPSAYSYINGWQYYNVNHTQRWLDSVKTGNIPVWRGEKLEGDERMRRTIMLGIKMGMDRRVFAETYGEDVVEAYPRQWDALEELGLVTVEPDEVRLTYLGKLLADEVGKAFYSEEMKQRMAAVDPAMISTTWPQINR